MQLKICPSCVELQPKQASCPACGTKLIPLTHEHHTRLLEVDAARRTRVWIHQMIAERVLPLGLADELLRRLPNEPFFPPKPEPAPPPEPEPPPAVVAPAPAPRVEEAPAIVPLAVVALSAAPLAETEPDLPPEAEDVLTDIGMSAEEKSESAGALGALTAVDDAEDGPGVGSWLYENIGWFLGATLVLAGSLYGVREAWQTLGDVPRHLVVSGALLGYHAGFVGVGAVVARRAQGPGRVLAGIGWLLLPVVFVGLSSLMEASTAVGLSAAVIASLIAFFTQGSIAARFETTSGLRLAQATLPALAAMLPVASWPAGSWPRQLAPMLGLLGVAAATRAADGWALFASAVSAASVWIFSIYGTPGEAATATTAPMIAAAALWVVGLAGLLREGLHREVIQQARPGLTRGLSVLALAATACATLAAAIGVRPSSTVELTAVYLAAAVGSVAIFARAQQRAAAAVHLLAPAAAITGWLLARTLFPQVPSLWPAGTSLVAGALLLVARHQERPGLLPWGLGLGLLALVQSLGTSTPALVPFLLTTVPLALAAHQAAKRWPALHYAGGVASAFLAFGVLWIFDPEGRQLGWIALGFAGIYGVIALLAKKEEGSQLAPLDDLSLLGGLAALLPVLSPLSLPPWMASAPPDRWPAPAELLRELLATQSSTLAAGAFLLLRTRRDLSPLVSLAGALALGLAVLRTFLVSRTQWPPHIVGVLALGSALVAALLWRPAPEPPANVPATRKFGGFLPLDPTHAPSAGGFAIASTFWTLAGVLGTVTWMSSIVELRRPFFVQGAALLCATAALWFVTPALGLMKARGSIPALVGVGLLGVLAALANRLGRPLPPAQVALRLTVVALLLWGISELLARTGERLGKLLGKPEHGKHYHVVATVGLAAVGVVMGIDAGLVGLGAPPALGTIPPLFLIGVALTSLLLARRTRSEIPLHLTFLTLLSGLALLGAQRSITGIPYIQLPGGAWQPEALSGVNSLLLAMPPLQAGGLFGLAAGSLGLAFLALLGHQTPLGKVGHRFLPLDNVGSTLRFWSTLGVVGCAIGAGWQASRPSAALMILTGLLIVGSGRAKLGILLSGVGATLLIHAQAYATGRIPAWSGPALAGLGLVALLGVEARKKKSFAEAFVAHTFAAVTSSLGLLHALSVGSSVTQDASLTALLTTALDPGAAGVLGTRVPALVFGQVALLTMLAARQAHRGDQGAYTRSLTTIAPPLLGWSFVVFWLAQKFHTTSAILDLPPTYSPGQLIRFVSPETTVLAAGLAGLALLTHAVSRSLADEEPHEGVGLGRDALLMATFCFASWHVARTSSGTLQPTLVTTVAGVGALAMVGLISVHAAWREASARHVYFVQLATVATYGVIRSTTARTFPPEADAIFALTLGFILVGVTVMARRAKLPPVAYATRLFAALLPLGVALALGNQEGYQQAAGALGSAMLYGALAWVERSRFLGALGAIAVNLALLLSALATGLNGLEIYLAPLGLFLLALGHLFAKSLESALRQWLRVLGSLLLYLPAAWSITFQLGLAPDARYPLVFGLVCLLGVAMGMLLRIRAYLVLGSAFLVLDVIANLVHAGLRNHRLGFLILSAAGLLILGGMVLSTLQRELFQKLVKRYRRRIANWE